MTGASLTPVTVKLNAVVAVSSPSLTDTDIMTVPVLLCVGVIDITIFSPMPSNLIVEIFTNVGFDELAVTSIWPKNT